MAPLAPGTYSITNVKFPNVVVLPDDNNDSEIVCRPEESSLREKWDVSCLGNRQYVIKNHALPRFASSVYGANEGDPVYGGQYAQHLIIKETKLGGRYTISPAAFLFWGLPDGVANTPITLANVATHPKNQWTFTPIGDMPQRPPNSVHTPSQGQAATAYDPPPMSSITPHILRPSYSTDASQPRSVGTNSSPPRPHRPASDAHVYIRNLILKGNGCPLYIPEPSGNSALHRTKGVRIGDVGFVTDDGHFTTLFNLRASVYDPINVRGVPDGFEQTDLQEDDIELIPDYFESGRIIASVTATSEVLGPNTPPAAGSSAVSNGHRLIWNTSEGAVLHLPRGSTRLRCDPGRFREHAVQNGYNWYKYARQTRRCDVHNGALCLVTGTDKTDTWMVGTFSQTPPGNQVLLDIGTDVAVHENFPCSYSWIGTIPAMRYSKCRPVMSNITVDHADMEQDDAVFRSDAPGGLTHCVFVRGFRISLRPSLWAYLSRRPLPTELSLIQDSSPEDFTGGQDRGHPPDVFSSFWDWAGGSPSGSQPFGSERNTQPINKEATVEYVPVALPVDPAMVVNDFLLDYAPEARVAVIHDDEWQSLMEEGDADFPNPPELFARLDRKYTVDVRTGCVSLLPLQLPLRSSSQRGSISSDSDCSESDRESDQGSMSTAQTSLLSVSSGPFHKQVGGISRLAVEPHSFSPTRSSNATTGHGYSSLRSSILNPYIFDFNFDEQTPAASPDIYHVPRGHYLELSHSSSAAALRSPKLWPSPVMDDTGQLLGSQVATPQRYSHLAQLIMFRELPRLDPHEYLFIPQQMYKPHTDSDRRRYVEELGLEEPIRFMLENPDAGGISLEDALRSRVKRLRQKEEPMFEGKGPSVSIRIEWPGYGQWSRQIPTNDFRQPPSPITRAKLAKNVAKCVQRFIEEKKGHAMDPEADRKWAIGDKPGQIKFEDLVLVSLHHVSMGSWQPQLRLKS